MILEKLITYANQAIDSEGDPLLSDPAFPSQEPVNYIITIDHGGNCLNIHKTGNEVQEGEKKIWRFNRYRIPAIGDRASEKQAGLLCDVTPYIFGAGPWSVTTRRDGTIDDQSAKHSSQGTTFLNVTDKAISAIPEDEAIRAAQKFYERFAGKFELLLRDMNLWFRMTAKNNLSVLSARDRFAFTLNGDFCPAFERPALQAYWRTHCNKRLAKKSADKESVYCLACGRLEQPVSTHERTIKNIPGGRGVKLISFDKPSFRSHGLKQSLNAPMCQRCVDAYTLGLNHLLERKATTNYIDNDSGIAYAFWSQEPVGFDLNASFVAADTNAVNALYQSIYRQSQADIISESEANKFYVLALSASLARAVVRDWIETHLPSVQRNIARWFDDLTIAVDRPWPNAKEPRATPPECFGKFPLRLLCRSLGREKQIGFEVPADLSSRLFRAGISGGVLPDSVLAAALRRIRADHDIRPPRAALIKLVLNRLSRSRNEGENEMSEKLDKEKPDIAYVCGRLLAVLERIQGRALGNVNASVIDRYYGAASIAPRPIFPRLVANAQNHLGKLRGERPGEATNLQKDMEAVVDKIGDRQAWIGDLPEWLDLEAQGRFAIGFYHQRADYRARVKKTPPAESGANLDSATDTSRELKGEDHAS